MGRNVVPTGAVALVENVLTVTTAFMENARVRACQTVRANSVVQMVVVVRVAPAQ